MKNRLLNICILCMVFPFFLQAADTHSVYNLRCEQEENPLGIETGQPCFSWQIQAQQRNFEQSAWQILVADSPEKNYRPAMEISGTAEKRFLPPRSLFLSKEKN